MVHSCRALYRETGRGATKKGLRHCPFTPLPYTPRMSTHPVLARLSAYGCAAAWLGLLVTLLGFFGSASWTLDLFSHFRFQYGMGLATVGLLLAVLRKFISVAVCAVGCAINAALLAPLFWGSPAPLPSDESPSRAMLFNVNTHAGDATAALAEIHHADPDILLLQEVNRTWLTELAILHDAYPHRIAVPRDDNFGIALFGKWPLEQPSSLFIGPSEIPSLTAIITTPDGPLAFVGTHPLPPFSAHYAHSRDAQLAALPQHVDSSRATLLLGDLNITPWHPRFRQLARDAGLRDSTRGFGYQPTWPNNIYPFRIPLDHALVSAPVRIHDRIIAPPGGSDHRALVLDFSIQRPPGE